MAGFLFGGQTGETMESLARKREIARRMAFGGQQPRNVGEGIAAVGNALAGVILDRRARSEEDRLRGEATSAYEAALGGMFGGGMGGAPSAAAAVPAASPGFSGGIDPSLIEAIESGGDPSAISPAGAAGAMQIMPTTALDPGFGVPPIGEFAAQYGLEAPPTDPEAMQAWLADPANVEANRAFGTAYLRAMEGRFGAGTPEAAAAYNAGPGAVERFGGVPPFAETQDYVEKVAARGGFDPSRVQAAIDQSDPTFRDVDVQPAPVAGGVQPDRLRLIVDALSQPGLSAGQQRVLEALFARETAAPEGMTPYQAAQLDLARQRLELQAAGKGGFAAPGTNVVVNTGDRSSQYGDPPKDAVWLYDENGQHVMEDVPGRPGMKRPVAAPVSGTASEDQRMAGMAQGVNTANTMLDVIDGIASDEQLKSATGWGSYVPFDIPGINARVRARMAQLEGQLFLQAFESLKGGGQITEVEGRKATEAMARLGRAQTYDDYIAALNELRGVVTAARDRANARLPEDRRWKPDAPELTRPDDVPESIWNEATEEEKRMLAQ